MGMRDGKLAFDGKEIALDTQLITLGRSTDNTIAFPTDSNVSRYHAEIEFRHGEYLLIDLGSSNGTSLNGQKITEAKLGDGDTILLGGSSEIKVSSGDQASKEAEDSLDPADDGEFSAGSSAGIPSFGSGGGGGSILSNFGGGSASGAAGAGGGTGGAAAAAAPAASNPTLLVAGVVGGLALVCVVAVGAIYLTRGSGCHGRAVVTKPEAGDTISQPVDVEVESQDTECVAAAVFTIDGNEIARAEEQPFTRQRCQPPVRRRHVTLSRRPVDRRCDLAVDRLPEQRAAAHDRGRGRPVGQPVGHQQLEDRRRSVSKPRGQRRGDPGRRGRAPQDAGDRPARAVSLTVTLNERTCCSVQSASGCGG